MRYFNYKVLFAFAILLLSSQNAHAYLLAPVFPTKPVCCSSVLFLPGVEGSRLYKNGLLENQLWEPNFSLSSPQNSDVYKLFLDIHGKSIDQTIYTRDIIDRTNIGLDKWDIDIYKKFSDQMNALTASGTISEWRARPYDWRLNTDDIADSVKLQNTTVSIIEEIKELAENSKNGKVTIVAHSNGGLVTKKIMSELEKQGKANLIENVILVAVPQLGTPEAIATLLHGDGQQIMGGVILNNTTAKEWVEHMPTAYNLLPSQKYFNSTSMSPVLFDASSSNMQNFYTTYGGRIDSYKKLESFITATADLRKKEPYTEGFIPNIGSSELIKNSEDFHNQFDEYVFPTSTHVIQLVGKGLPTLQAIKYTPKNPCEFLHSASYCLVPAILDREPIMTTNGDGTVIAESAQASTGDTYFIDLNSSNKAHNTNLNHGTIFQDDSVIDVVTQVITQKPISSTFVSYDQNSVKNKTFFETSVHSPVSIGVTHSDGTAVSVSNDANISSFSDFTFVDQSIPNSKYMNFGEGKYIWTSEPEVVSMQGQELGTFTVNVKKLEDNNTSDIKTWQDVPVASTTKITLDLQAVNSNVASSSLKIDVNGDGNLDISLTDDSSGDLKQIFLLIKGILNQVEVSPKIRITYEKRIDTAIKYLEKNKLKQAKTATVSLQKLLLSRIQKPDSKHPRYVLMSKQDAQDILNMIDTIIDKI